MMKCLFYAFVVLWSMSASAQHIYNPSFEGKQGASLSPPFWEPFGKLSSPDTQPGEWSVNTVPALGDSYLSLICRGEEVASYPQCEACLQNLSYPIYKGKLYTYSIDLARSPSFSSGVHKYDQGLRLKIYGISEKQGKELLWESEIIDNVNWERFQFVVSPLEANYEGIVLEANYANATQYSGNVLIDNFYYHPEL